LEALKGLFPGSSVVKIEGVAKQVTVYVNSTDQWHGQPLYAAIVQLCRERGMAGATVTRCTEGYGSGGRMHTARRLELSENVPMQVDIVDLGERIEPLLTAMQPMLAEGLVTVVDVQIIRYLPDPTTREAK